MRKKFLSLLGIVFIISMPASFTTKAEEIKKDPSKYSIIGDIKNTANITSSLQEKDGQVFISGKLSENGIAGKETALNYLEKNKSLFGIDSTANDLQTLKLEKDSLGHTYAKFVQVINGLKVDGSMINVHFDKNGSIASVNGKLNKNKSVEKLGNKNITESEAVEIAKKQYTFDFLRNTPKVERVILTKDDKNYEVFKVNISFISPIIGNYDVYIEVNSGNVIQKENKMRFDGATTGTGIDVLGKTKNLNLFLSSGVYQMKDISKAATSGITTYSFNNDVDYLELVTNNTNSFNTEAYKASVSAHYNAGKVIDFYKILFNRNSLDNQGMAIKSYTHYDVDYNNAFWDGYEMIYGDGDGEEFTYLSGDLDVVGHEMTHGVIDHTAGLYYHNQSGALNESMADVFGVLISTYDKYNVASGGTWKFSPADWVVGDDIYTPNTPGDALRSLSDPMLYGQPDNMSIYQELPDIEYYDWGGVHINSGITNKAAYNIASSIGMEKTAKIYYRALTNYMSYYTDFVDARKCLVQAATDLYGVGSDVSAVKSAFDSVGILQDDGNEIVKDPYEPNDTKSNAYPINFGETYESYKSNESDVDVYKLNVTAPGEVNINLWNLPYDYDLVLHNANGYRLDSSINPDTENESINYQFTTKGTYYILVGSWYSDFSVSKKYSLKADLVIPIPTALKAVSSSFNSITTSWGTVAGASGYEVYRATSSTGAYSLVGNTTGTSFNNTGLVTNNTYYYKVRAYKTIGSSKVYSNFSQVVSAKPVIPVPTSVKATPSSYNSISTSWLAVAGANGYEVYRAASSTGTYGLVGTTTGLSFNNTGLATNSTYYYKVRAYTMVGTLKVYSDFSVIVSTKPIPATPISISSVSSSYNSINTLWTAVAGASGYEVYRSTSSTGAYSLISTVTGTSYNNTGLTTNVAYYFKVRAYRLVGTTKVYGNFTTAVGARPIPAVPVSVKAVSSSYNSINTSWLAVAGASGYEVYRATSSAGTYSYLTTTTGTSFNNTGLVTNAAYYYKVRAYRLVVTTKVYGNFTAVVGARPIPAVPVSVKATSSSYNSISTSWLAVAGASGYEVYRATSSTGTYSYIGATTGTSYNNTGLISNAAYYYKVRAYRLVGTAKVYGNFTAIVGARPIPAAPINLKATKVNSKSIKLAWSGVVGANGYEVYRSTASTGAYSLVASTTSLSYTNSGLTTGKTYYYKIRSYRTVGTLKVYSVWSAIVYIKP
jgi:Zn-dependent metalloprotease/fibronectin type 3 domain-containing protein